MLSKNPELDFVEYVELDKLLKKRSIISCTIKDGICIVQYASREMKLLDISGMGIVEVLDFILEE